MKNQKGQSLIEALIALGAAAVIVSAITVASITAINNSDYSKYQNLAGQYADQGLEYLRQLSASNWSGFLVSLDGIVLMTTIILVIRPGRLSSCSANIKNEKGNEFFTGK